jgi:hypothetical protein
MFRSSADDLSDDPRYQQLVASLRDRLFGPDGPAPDADFGAIEELAHQAGRSLARDLCSQAASQQARSADLPQPCPDCGRPCDGRAVARELTTRDGPIRLDEARYHCPRCRRDFFPQPSGPAADAPPV